MRKVNLIATTYLLFALFSCNSIDFSNPEEVMTGFTFYANKKVNEKLYDYLSARSKEYVTKDEFANERMLDDNLLKQIKAIERKVIPIPIDVNYPKYRRFKIEEKVLFKNDTIRSRHYYSLINENGDWKVIWPKTLTLLADQKSCDGDCAGARKILEKVIEWDPFNGSAFDLLALSYYRDNSLPRNEREEGIAKNVKYALTLENDCSNHYNTLAIYLSSIGEENLAIQNRLNAIRYCLNESDKTLLYSNIANSYISLHEYENAYEYVKKGIQINPRLPDLWLRIGMIMARTNNVDKAIEYFERALSLEKMENNLEATLYAEYANCCYAKNQCSTAKKYISRALMLNPTNEDYQTLSNYINNCSN